MSLDQMAERQKRQLEELDKLQSSLDALKRRAGGGSGSGTLVVTVSRIFEAAITAAFPDLVSALDKDQWLKINPTSDAKFGDYQCNSAMVIHKFLKDHGDTSCKAPRDVSTKILESMGQNEVLVKTEIAGPGFINAYLNPQWVAAQCAKILKDGPGVPSVETQNIVVDFSSPNIAKEMHVGHLRSTIIGESICRVLEFCGHRVSRINHVGDWGTQFGMLINHLRTAYPDFNEKPPNISDLTGFYKEAKKRFDEDEAFKKASQMAVVTLQSGDEFSLKCWNTLCAVSRIQFKMVYDRLECQGLVEQGESFYNSRIPPIVAELKGKGLIEESEGAQIIHCGRQIPLMAVKSDGGFGYDSTDLAAVKYRIQDMKSQRVIYVTDAGQSEHFEMIFVAAKKAGTYEYRGLHYPGDYQFSYDKMLDLKGNTAIYLMYSYARICSIASKAGVQKSQLASVLPSVHEAKERALCLHLLKFPEVVERVADWLLPHLICEFLYDTAEKFNEFYRECKVVGDPQQNPRLVLCEATAVVMKKGMFLLGITPLEKI